MNTQTYKQTLYLVFPPRLLQPLHQLKHTNEDKLNTLDLPGPYLGLQFLPLARLHQLLCEGVLRLPVRHLTVLATHG